MKSWNALPQRPPSFERGTVPFLKIKKGDSPFIFFVLGLCALLSSCSPLKSGGGCLTGAFLGDAPTVELIDQFETDYGKRPAIVLAFLDWGRYPDEAVLRDVYRSGSVLMLTWEPWDAVSKKGIDYDAVIEGKDNAYISGFAARLKAVGKPVLLRFAHEMNGDWYPWSGQKISPEKYRRLFRYVHGIFERAGATNVRWVFSVNAENVPASNDHKACYPGERFVDYVGLDGYNWGTTRVWSRWRSFKEIFGPVYSETVREYRKPVILSELSTTSLGGDKARWIRDALEEIRKMPEVRGMVLFNVDKETDWRFVPASPAGLALRRELSDDYFKELF